MVGDPSIIAVTINRGAFFPVAVSITLYLASSYCFLYLALSYSSIGDFSAF
jgi:hypothetical protein